MAEKQAQTEIDGNAHEAAGKPSKTPLVFGLLAAIAFGAGGFYASYTGLLKDLVGGADAASQNSAAVAGTQNGTASQTGSMGGGEGGTKSEALATPLTATFVEIDPLVVSLGTGQSLAHLRFRGHLEVNTGAEDTVQALMPRVMDVLNGYLRATRPEELSDPTMLIRLRAQMLRRVQLVVGEGLVKDLLVSEFVLN
ncbi:MAG: flagellar basal body-associated FliL family protein [Rhodobacteraceae bacterium]|nr:flagellar basal body-associated FliL family protein [Paracoccaceae bacterium]